MPLGGFGKTMKAMALLTADSLMDKAKDIASNEKIINAGKTVLKTSGTLVKGAISAVEAHNANMASIKIEFEEKNSDELKGIVRSNGFTSYGNAEKSVALRILRDRGDDYEFNKNDREE